jgi:hypothetical protein
MEKSIVLFNELGEEEKGQLMEVLVFACRIIDSGLKYLGFELKPNSYSFNDWAWLIKKFKSGFPPGHTSGCLEVEY